MEGGRKFVGMQDLRCRSEASMRNVHKYFGVFVKCQGQPPTGLKLHLNQCPYFRIIEWYQVPSRGFRTETYSFEVILYESTNRIKFQYLDVDSGTSHDLGASATVGIENFEGTAGVQFSYNTGSLHNGLTIEFIPAQPRCDFNGDGKTDILWRHKTTGKNAVWFMDGVTYIGNAYLPSVTDLN